MLMSGRTLSFSARMKVLVLSSARGTLKQQQHQQTTNTYNYNSHYFYYYHNAGIRTHNVFQSVNERARLPALSSDRLTLQQQQTLLQRYEQLLQFQYRGGMA